MFIAIPKKTNTKDFPNYRAIAYTSKIMLKITQGRIHLCVKRECPDAQAIFRRGRRTQDQIANL